MLPVLRQMERFGCGDRMPMDSWVTTQLQTKALLFKQLLVAAIGVLFQLMAHLVPAIIQQQ